MTDIYDAGALVALERNDRAMWVRLKAALGRELPPVTHAGVVGQVWRGGSGRQALLARAVAGMVVASLDPPLGRSAGELLGAAHTADVVDAAVVLLGRTGDRVFTSDPNDSTVLADAAGISMDVLAV